MQQVIITLFEVCLNGLLQWNSLQSFNQNSDCEVTITSQYINLFAQILPLKCLQIISWKYITTITDWFLHHGYMFVSI